MNDQQLLNWLNAPFIAYDTETTGLRIEKGHKPFCYIISFDKTRFSVPFEKDRDYGFDYGNIRTIVTRDKFKVKPLLENPDVGIAAHNMKFDRLMSKVEDIKLNGPLYCTAVCSHLLDENSSNSLDFVSSIVLKDLKLKKQNDELEEWFELNKIKKSERRYDQVPWEIMKKYAAWDSLVVYLMWERFKRVLVQTFNYRGVSLPPLARTFYQEMMLNEVLCKAYYRGLQVDVEYLKSCKQYLEDDMLHTEWEIYALNNDEEFNINSGKQVAQVLINNGAVLNLTEKSFKNVKTFLAREYRYRNRVYTSEDIAELNVERPEISIPPKLINFGTGEDDIKNLGIPVAELIVEYKYTKKLLGTYIEVLLESQVNGVVRPNLNQLGAATGRFSCTGPALQTCPSPMKASKFLNDDGTVKEKYAKRGWTPKMVEKKIIKSKMVRKSFVPRKGFSMFAVDFKQQEFRAFLDYTGEEEYIRQVNEEDADYHDLIMEQLPEYLTDRGMAKTYNFMVLYGAGPQLLSEVLGITYKKAKELIDAFFARFPAAARFKQNLEHRVINVGVFCNKFGRYRRLRSGDSFKALNSLIQGVCADYTKEKMIQVQQFLERHGGHVLLSIHDELIFEVPEGKESLVSTVCKIMSASNDLSIIKELGLYSFSDTPLFKIKLGVDPNIIRNNWAEKEEWILQDE